MDFTAEKSGKRNACILPDTCWSTVSVGCEMARLHQRSRWDASKVKMLPFALVSQVSDESFHRINAVGEVLLFNLNTVSVNCLLPSLQL